MDLILTIFTPTYNRAETLKDCYTSLQAQTIKNFIWQIIDDGSSDHTEQLVSQWIEQETSFPIQYFKVKNGGKARAINKSLELTDTKLWLCLDSDDTLVENAAEAIFECYEKIKYREDICGLFSLRGKNKEQQMQAEQIPDSVQEATQSQIRYELGIPPEYAHVFKTEIAKKYKYPSIEGENYIPLSYVFDQIDRDYKYSIIHKPIMICEYRPDGLTNNKRQVIIKNPKGYAIYKRQLIEFASSRKEKYKAIATYVTACLLSGSNPFKNNPHKLLTLLLFPIGLMDYLLRYKLSMRIDFEIDTRRIK